MNTDIRRNFIITQTLLIIFCVFMLCFMVMTVLVGLKRTDLLTFEQIRQAIGMAVWPMSNIIEGRLGHKEFPNEDVLTLYYLKQGLYLGIIQWGGAGIVIDVFRRLLKRR